jgi:hypothetical protein
MPNNILTNWNFIKVIRFVLGIIVILQALLNEKFMFLIPGVLFTVVALFNKRCCGTNGCATPKSKRKDDGKI